MEIVQLATNAARNGYVTRYANNTVEVSRVTPTGREYAIRTRQFKTEIAAMLYFDYEKAMMKGSPSCR